MTVVAGVSSIEWKIRGFDVGGEARKGKSGSRGKPALIISSEPSNWISCRVITPNLERSYREAFGRDLDCFSYSLNMNPAEIWELAGRIHEARPSKVIFIAPQPHPSLLLLALKQHYRSRPLPPFTFHVYGDFTLFTAGWIRIEGLLKTCRVQFVCASDRQSRLISRFVVDPSCVTARCPFPVDKSVYDNDPKLRESWRARLGVGPEEFLVLYTGRLSLQKNIIRLTQEVGHFFRATGIPVRFFLAGDFDNIGAPFFGVNYQRGFYFQQWLRANEKLEPAFQERIHHLGHLPPTDLRGLYNAADVYVSLSLHHDEDFGMSPAEALCCGTPVVLSDWGGYASFMAAQEDNGTDAGARDSACDLVGVRIGEQGLALSSEEFQRGLFVAAASEDKRNRGSISRKSQSRLSIEAAAGLLTGIHRDTPPVFKGFNWRFREFANRFTRGIPFPEGPCCHTFYEEVYASYTNAEN